MQSCSYAHSKVQATRLRCRPSCTLHWLRTQTRSSSNPGSHSDKRALSYSIAPPLPLLLARAHTYGRRQPGAVPRECIVQWLDWHSKGDVLSCGSKDGSAWMFSLPHGTCLQAFMGHGAAVTCGRFTRDGTAEQRWRCPTLSGSVSQEGVSRVGYSEY